MRKQQFQVGDRQVRCVPEPGRGATAGLKTVLRTAHILVQRVLSIK